jgi:transcription elongation factor GreA
MVGASWVQTKYLHCKSSVFAVLLEKTSGAIGRLLYAFQMMHRIEQVKQDQLRLMEKIPLTRAGHTALNTELKHLKSEERPAIIRAIAEAREHGDLSENAEYHSAREKQSFIEGRIKELEGTLSLAQVIDPATLSGTIKFSATVTIVDEDTDEEKTYQIVGEPEADIESAKLNIKSPLARALIGKEEGDSVEVRTPGGGKTYEILKIEWI